MISRCMVQSMSRPNASKAVSKNKEQFKGIVYAPMSKRWKSQADGVRSSAPLSRLHTHLKLSPMLAWRGFKLDLKYHSKTSYICHSLLGPNIMYRPTLAAPKIHFVSGRVIGRAHVVLKLAPCPQVSSMTALLAFLLNSYRRTGAQPLSPFLCKNTGEVQCLLRFAQKIKCQSTEMC